MKKRICMFMALWMLGATACTSAYENGSELLAEMKIEEAQQEFQKSIDEEKDVAESYRGLGICYYEQKKYEESLEAFEQALNEGTEATAVLYNLAGVCAMQIEQYEKSVFYFAEGQQYADASEELKKEMAFNLVISYEKLGELSLARECLEEYVERYPEDEMAVKELEFLNTQS